MSTTFEGEVLHVVGPDEQSDHDLSPYLERAAEGRYVLVCRRGGRPSWLERVVSFLRRDPIDAVTVITDEPAAEDDLVVVTARETELSGVYDATDLRIED